MNKKLRLKKGDTVIVIAGNDKGKEGKVLEVNPQTERILVEGVNMITKHTKPNAKYPQGGLIKQEASIHISNVMVKCPETGYPTRVGRRRSTVADKTGKLRLERFSKQSQSKKALD